MTAVVLRRRLRAVKRTCVCVAFYFHLGYERNCMNAAQNITPVSKRWNRMGGTHARARARLRPATLVHAQNSAAASLNPGL
jgi:hypothetical protein